MRNSWKGMVIGGLTGAVVGIALDLTAAAWKQASLGAEHARERAPEAAEWLQGITARAAVLVHDPEVPERVREVAHRILGTDLLGTANAAVSKVVETSKDVA